MREAEPDRVDDAATIEVVEVGKVAAAGPVPCRHRVVDRAAPCRHRRAGSSGSDMSCRPSAIRMSFSCVMPPMPDPSVRMKYRLAWMTGFTDVDPGGCRGQQLRVGLRDVVALHEGRRRQLPVHRQQARLPPLGAQRARPCHSSCLDANGSMQSRNGGASSSRLIHAQPPHSSHRTGARSRSSAHMLPSSNASGRSTNVFFPSRPQHHPWNGQTKLRRDPLPSTSFMPRWRQEL